VIEVQHVSHAFDGHIVLKDISFSLAKGERVSLTGPGGCGKTTLFKILMGLVVPDAGKVVMMGKDIHRCPEEEQETLLKSIGIAFQQGGLFDSMSVRENLEFAMRHMTSASSTDMDKEIKRLLTLLKLPRTESMLPHELSGGMKRRIGIARAMCTDPKVAFFDEPTAGLDPVTTTIILNMIQALNAHEGREPTTMMVATSNIEAAIRFADRIIVLNQQGEIVADGPWRKLLVSGPEWVQHFLSLRLIGLDIEYARGLDLPPAFLTQHWETPALS
jgi:phospholipid/cholesterol/gamma-HCH transport system ATP-binding protein